MAASPVTGGVSENSTSRAGSGDGVSAVCGRGSCAGGEDESDSEELDPDLWPARSPPGLWPDAELGDELGELVSVPAFGSSVVSCTAASGLA